MFLKIRDARLYCDFPVKRNAVLGELSLVERNVVPIYISK
jgi:hypothetical protein